MVGYSTSVAESGVTSERDNNVFTAIRAGIHGKALGRITAGDDLADLGKNDGTNFAGILCTESIPVI